MRIDAETISVNTPNHEGYVEYDIRLTVHVVGQTFGPATLTGWVTCGWLPPHASQDLDGSGLARWGDPCPRWRVTRTDGADSGDPSVTLTDESVCVADADGRIRLRIAHPHLDAAEVADAIVDALASEAERIAASVEPPEADEVWSDLYRSSVVTVDDTDSGIRVGTILGSPVLAWCDSDGPEYVVWPDADDCRRAVDALHLVSRVAAAVPTVAEKERAE